MTEKEKIREEVERLRNLHQIKYQNLDTNDNMCLVECGKRNLCNELLSFIDSLQEEPVSKELDEEIEKYLNALYSGWSESQRKQDCLVEELCIKTARHFANWQKQQDKETIELAEDHAMFAGMEKMKEKMMKNIWKPADGDDLPEIDREVVVFTQNFPNDAGIMCVAIGHRPNPNGWEGKSIATGKVEHYTPKTYDKGGWNIPDVKYWLDTGLPNMED